MGNGRETCPKHLPEVRPAAIAVMSAHPTMLSAHLCRPSLALASPALAQAENYTFNFKANPGADGGGTLSTSNDIAFKLLVDTQFTPSISLSNLNKSQYWKNGGFILEMTHNGKTVRLNDAILGTSGPLELGSGGFVEIRYDIDDFFDVDFHPGASFVEANELSYDAFVYGQIDVYNNQKPFQDLFAIATTGNTSLLKNYVSQVPEPSVGVLALLGAMAVFQRRKRMSA